MAKKNEWKKREGIVYSTASDFDYQHGAEKEEATLPPAQQQLKVSLDKSGRAGKQVTLVSNFVGTSDDLEKLGKMLKTKCGVGGSTKDGTVIIQGDMRDKVMDVLQKEGFKAKRSG